jgi:hypothetical protein
LICFYQKKLKKEAELPEKFCFFALLFGRVLFVFDLCKCFFFQLTRLRLMIRRAQSQKSSGSTGVEKKGRPENCWQQFFSSSIWAFLFFYSAS